jgi:hypothetical protein
MAGRTISASAPSVSASLATGRGARRGQFRDADHDRHPAGHHLDGGLQRPALFVSLERIVLAAGAQHHQAVHAVADQGVEHLLAGVDVD